MRRIDAPFDLDTGPLVSLRIGLTRKDIRARQAAGLVIPTAVEVRGLIDTGAECTCVSPDVVSRLDLPAAAYFLTNAPGVRGLGVSPVRAAALTVLHPSGLRADRLYIHATEVYELDLGIVGYDALIGRDLLARCVLTYNRPVGTFTLEYR